VVGGEVVTRGFFHKKLTTFVNLLKKKGVKAEHRVLMTVSPSVDFYALAVAVFAIGGVVVLVNPGMELVKINHCIKLAKPDVWLCSCQSWLRWMHVSGLECCVSPVVDNISSCILP
jgi:acyl-coenzyme A synthetase/AMP-(fatty) acid ligase